MTSGTFLMFSLSLTSAIFSDIFLLFAMMVLSHLNFCLSLDLTTDVAAHRCQIHQGLLDTGLHGRGSTNSGSLDSRVSNDIGLDQSLALFDPLLGFIICIRGSRVGR